jgi:hypothetical protein
VTFESWVVRGASGKLSFVYDFENPNTQTVEVADEVGQLTARNFDGFSTDVSATADITNGKTTTISRSSDGSAITIRTATPGLGTTPWLVVATDATNFDRAGSVTGLFIDDANDLHGGFTTLAATIDVANTFQPTEQTAAVPLPPAVYGGLGMIALVCGSQLRRRTAKS